MLNENERCELLEEVRQSLEGDLLLGDELMSRLIYTVVESYDNLLRRQRSAHQLKRIAEAKARGIRFGRTPMERPENTAEVLGAYKRGELSSREAAKKLGVTHKTVSIWAAKSSLDGN